MESLRLYERYDRDAAVGFFGSEKQARSSCDGLWLVFPEVILCLTTIGPAPKMSHFEKGNGFCWVADQPYNAGGRDHFWSIPPQIFGQEARGRAVHLFVRSSASQDYMYLGECHPSCTMRSGSSDNYSEARFELKITLPSSVWAEIGGPETGDLNHAAVDSALAQLVHPTTVQQRLAILQTIVEYWHGPIGPEDGFREHELGKRSLPMPLRWWFRWAGRREKTMSGQNKLLLPEQICTTDGDLLVFYGENQWCYEWATEPKGDDPPVFGRDGQPQSWQPEGITLSEHLILACLFEATMCHSPYGAGAACVDAEVLREIVQHIPPVPINPWRWTGETRFYARNGAFMFTMGKDNSDVWIGAKTEHPLQFLKPLLDRTWDYAAI